MSQDAGSKVDLWRKMMGGTSTPDDSLTASSAAPTPISFAKDGGGEPHPRQWEWDGYR